MHPMTDANQTDHLHHALSSGADEQPARLQRQQLRIQRDAARYRSRTPPDRAWLRGLVGLLIAACIIAAPFLLRSPHGDTIARWIPQFTLPSSAPPQKSAADVKARAKRDQVTAATAMAERVTAATEVAILMARPEIKSLADLAGRSIAIDDKEDVVSGRVRTAMAAGGAAEVQLIPSQTKAIDRVIGGEVPASVLILASPDAAEGFPDIAGFKIFRVPLSEPSSAKSSR